MGRLEEGATLAAGINCITFALAGDQTLFGMIAFGNTHVADVHPGA